MRRISESILIAESREPPCIKELPKILTTESRTNAFDSDDGDQPLSQKDPTVDSSKDSAVDSTTKADDEESLPNIHSIVDGIYRKMRIYIMSEIDKHSILSNKTPGKKTLSVAELG